LIYAAVFGLFFLAFKDVFFAFMQQIEAQQAAVLAGQQPAPPSFPFAFFLGYFCFLFVAMFLQFVYMVGFAEISMRPTPAVKAMQLAMTAILKNALQLVLLLICIGIAASIVLFLLMIIIVLVVVVLSFIHPAVGAIAAFALYIPILLCMYPLIFAGHYFMWKSMLGGGDIPAVIENTSSTLSA
jgi:hypothetical protein